MNPITRKRLRRFRANRRGFWSLIVLAGLYGISLVSEFVCNDRPILMRFEGKTYVPVVRYYPETTFTDSGRLTRPDYKSITAGERFTGNPDNWAIYPPVPFGPNEQILESSIPLDDFVTVRVVPDPAVGTINVTPDWSVTRALGASIFFGIEDRDMRHVVATNTWTFTEAVADAVARRFANTADAEVRGAAVHRETGERIAVSLPPFRERSREPRTVRLTLRPVRLSLPPREVFTFDRDGSLSSGDAAWLEALPASARSNVQARVANRFEHPVEDQFVVVDDVQRRIAFEKPEVRFPYPPVENHPLGIDQSGRDVLARILYGLRTSVTFGFALALLATLFGTLAGALQGYLGGRTDLLAQRFTEIWSAIPFLYVIILLGATVRRGFEVLLFASALFHWIGISYYVRAEFLRLRGAAFVDAARCLGLPPTRIMFRHILPNALVPIITYFPFAVVGAISALAALDYLGFGLPPPTPSWGEMLGQAQEHRAAWWLVAYPSAALILVILLGVFIGEGVRDAYDPRKLNRIE